MNPEPHPDAISDYAALKKETIGAHQAAEDMALKNYHEYIAAGKSIEEASQMYFETITFFYHGLHDRRTNI